MSENTSKFGLIGGVGPLRTVPYYLGIVNGVQKRSGRPYFPRISIESLSCFDVMGLGAAGRLDELCEYLLNGLRALANAGVTHAAMACFTGHTVFDRLAEKSPVPLLHILEPTIEEFARRNIRKIAFLGTVTSMNCPAFQDRFLKAGIEPSIPDTDTQKTLARIIETELEFGNISSKAVRFAEKTVQKLVAEQDTEAVCLGCTELGMLFEKVCVSVPAIDPVPSHIEAIVDTIWQSENASDCRSD